MKINLKIGKSDKCVFNGEFVTNGYVLIRKDLVSLPAKYQALVDSNTRFNCTNGNFNYENIPDFRIDKTAKIDVNDCLAVTKTDIFLLAESNKKTRILKTDKNLILADCVYDDFMHFDMLYNDKVIILRQLDSFVGVIMPFNFKNEDIIKMIKDQIGNFLN